MVEPYTLKEIAQEPAARTNVEKQLGEYERAVMNEIESVIGLRYEALKHLIVGGNVLVHIGADKIRVFHLDSYVVSRAPNGDVLEVVTVEHVCQTLWTKRQRLISKVSWKVMKRPLKYTHTLNGRTRSFMCIKKSKAASLLALKANTKQTTYPSYLFGSVELMARIMVVFVEELLGDLRSLEALSQAIVEGAAAAAKVLFMVNPNGTTRMRTIAQAENTAIIEGNRTDVSVLQMDKFNDFRVAYQAMQGIEERLSQQSDKL